MDYKIDGHPDWTVEIKEVSNCAYKLLAKHRLGPSIGFTGGDPDELLSRLSDDLKVMELEIAKKIRQSSNG